MNLTDYSKKSIEYEKSLASSYRKENGIFYTNLELAKKIITFLDIPIESSIMDPCCGTGSFLVAAIKLGYNKVYGADIDKRAIKIASEYIDLNNIKVLDTISNNSHEVLKKFKLLEPLDYILGNPPYAPFISYTIENSSDYLFEREVKDSGNNLFIASLYRAFDLVKPHGTISYIIPKNFLHIQSYSMMRKMILKNKQILSIIDIGSYFKNVRGEQIVITIKNNHIHENIIRLFKYENNEFKNTLEVPQDFYDNEILLFDNELDFKIFQKLEKSYKKMSDICTGYVGRGKSKSKKAIRGRDLRKFSFKDFDVPKEGNKLFIQNIYSAESGIIGSFAGNLEASETVTIFTDGDENMCRYVLGFLHSRLCNYYLMKFCFNNSRLTMHTDAKYLNKLPLVVDKATFLNVISIVKALETIEYMSTSWFEMAEDLNELIYRTYDIYDSERKYIDDQMKNIQSQRWYFEKQK